jgi:hypothetical protein
MKKKSMKKLMMNKSTLINLSKERQLELAGGIAPTNNLVCPTPGTRCYHCDPPTLQPVDTVAA